MSHGSTPLRSLFADRRFLPLFFTQALGALNDNVVKNAMVVLITFKAVSLGGLSSEKLVALCGGLFILPFFLFSGWAGQIADQKSKSSLSVVTKVLEIVVVAIAGIGFLSESFSLLLFALFLLGVQSTFFGPIKYGILPELLKPEELITGNALIEMGTFVAILIGTILGGLLVGLGDRGPIAVSAGALAFSVMGWFASRKIPHQAPSSPEIRISRDPFSPNWELLRIAKKVKSVYLSILAISWFWLFGSIILAVLPSLAKNTLGASETVLTFFLALFSVGVGTGSILCGKLSFEKLELGLVPIGSIGMTFFAFDLGWMDLPRASTLTELFSQSAGWRASTDLFFLSIFSGLFTVPLYTLLQVRSDPKERSRIVAANNVLNAVFMVVGALGLMILLSFDLSPQKIFLIVAALNALVAIAVYSVLPEFLFRFLLWVLARLMYRLRIRGNQNFPDSGAALLVCNHVSFVDWMMISAACPRPIRFVMHSDFMKIPIFGTLARHAKVIPIAGRKEDPKLLEIAFQKISEELSAGELVCIFPEGELTRNGNVSPFRPGLEKALRTNPVPVIPMALNGMWGSFFSRKHGNAMTKPFRRIWSRISLDVGDPILPTEVTAKVAEDAVVKLLGNASTAYWRQMNDGRKIRN